MSAIDNALAIEGAKLSSATVCVGALASGAPLFVPVAGLAFAGYAMAVALDSFLTGKCCLFPLSRMSVGDILGLAGGHSREDSDEDWHNSYASRSGLEAPLPVFQLEPPTIDVPVVRPVVPQQPIHPLMAPVPAPVVERRAVASPPIATAMTAVERRSVAPVEVLPDRAWLLERLKSESPEFVRLLKAPPIRCVGQQRTGKTTFVKLLCMCRLIILKGHQVIAATPHYKEGEDYPESFRIVGIKGRQRDPVSIAQQWSAMSSRIQQCGMAGRSYTNIWDEFGLYDNYVSGDDLLKVMTSSLRETTKFGEYPIFIVHGETSAFLPGVKGLVTPFLDGTTRVETIGAPTEDAEGLPEVKPTGRFKITWTDGTRTSGQIPEWMTMELLQGILDRQQPTVAAPVETTIESLNVDPWTDSPSSEPDRWEQADASPTPPRAPLSIPGVRLDG